MLTPRKKTHPKIHLWKVRRVLAPPKASINLAGFSTSMPQTEDRHVSDLLDERTNKEDVLKKIWNWKSVYETKWCSHPAKSHLRRECHLKQGVSFPQGGLM
jgi:hypothetical protein